MDDVEVLTFDEIWKMTDTLVDVLQKSNFQPDILVGISRGGLVVTRIISDILGIYSVGIIGVGFYKGIEETEKKPSLTQDITLNLAGKKILLIDDVSDTGKSLEYTVKLLEERKIAELRTATLHYKPHSIFKPDYHIINTSSWIVYPWEYCEFSRLYVQKMASSESKKTIAQNLLNMNLPKRVVDRIIEKKK